MIESFNEFLEKSGYTSLFENSIPGVYVPGVDGNGSNIGDVFNTEEDFDKPEFVSDNRYLLKATSIILKHLKNNFDNIDWNVHPYIITANGKKATMIYCDEFYLVLSKNGIDKVIIFFNEDPLENSNVKSVFSVSTKKFGWLSMIRTLISTLNVINNKYSPISEAREVTPKAEIGISPVTKISDGSPKKITAAFMGKLVSKASRARETDDTTISRESANEFLKLFEKYDDPDILKIMTSDFFDDTEDLYPVQRALFITSTGDLDSTNGHRTITLVHMALCGTTHGLTEDKAQELKDLWFFNAGKSGRLSTYINEHGLWDVREAESVINEKIDDLEERMEFERRSVEAMLQYVKKGGKEGTTEKLEGIMALTRGILVTGTAGIGKSVGIEKAIKNTGAIEGIHYISIGAVSTPQTVYKNLYRFNNMVLIYDDTPNLWDDDDKISLFKKATSETEKERKLTAPTARGLNAGDQKSEFYDVMGERLSRRERYYLEVGSISEYDKGIWIKKEIKKLTAEDEAKTKKDPEYSGMSAAALRLQAEQNFEKYAEQKQRALIPNQFIFNGFIVFVSNKPIEKFSNSRLIAPHWGALSSRLTVIDISPTQRVVWEWIKRKIYDDINNEELPDELRILPKKGKAEGSDIDNVMSYMEDIVDGKYNTETEIYGKVVFRTITTLRKYIGSSENSEKMWKMLILQKTLIDSKRSMS